MPDDLEGMIGATFQRLIQFKLADQAPGQTGSEKISRVVMLLFSKGLAQGTAVYLAGSCSRQGVEPPIFTGLLVSGQLGFGQTLQFLARGRAGPEQGDDAGGRTDLQFRRRDIARGGMARDHLFDFGRGDAKAASIHDVIFAPQQGDGAISIGHGMIAGDEPVAAKTGGSVLGLVQIAKEKPRIVAVDGQ